MSESEYKSAQDLFHRVDDATRIEAPHGWIQWQGTNVCMDIHCTCGAHLHKDGEFFFNVRCGNCGTAYAVGAYVKLVPLTRDEEAHVERSSSSGIPTLHDDRLCALDSRY